LVSFFGDKKINIYTDPGERFELAFHIRRKEAVLKKKGGRKSNIFKNLSEL